MTCRCPPSWCYRRPDCRHLNVLRLAWLKQRQGELVDELDAVMLPREREAKSRALAAIADAIARRT